MHGSAEREPVEEWLGLAHAPVALCFVDEIPEGIPRASTRAPAGCGYWLRAAGGESFYTGAEDHHGCPIGCHTHGIELPAAKARDLDEMVATLVGLAYLDPREVERLPRRSRPFRYLVCSPLSRAPGEPDVVLVRGSARQLMLLHEAALAADVPVEGGLMGRPTCAVVPESMRRRAVTHSLGCVGNRVYTGLADGESWVAVPGESWPAIVARIPAIVRANRALETFHRSRV